MTKAQPPRENPHRIRGPVLMGVVPGQPLAVTHRAAELAYSLDVELFCAYVDASSYPTGEGPDGSVGSRPIDPDGVEDEDDSGSLAIENRLSAVLSPYGISWSYRRMAGDPARTLGRLAQKVDASVIVVGTRERGMGHKLEEMLTGSVAVHLAHRQCTPVLVVPLDPHTSGAAE